MKFTVRYRLIKKSDSDLLTSDRLNALPVQELSINTRSVFLRLLLLCLAVMFFVIMIGGGVYMGVTGDESISHPFRFLLTVVVLPMSLLVLGSYRLAQRRRSWMVRDLMWREAAYGVSRWEIGAFKKRVAIIDEVDLEKILAGGQVRGVAWPWSVVRRAPGRRRQ